MFNYLASKIGSFMSYGDPSQTPQSFRPATPNQPAKREEEEIVVGQGGENEMMMSIGGVQHLFVAEADCVIEFVPGFDCAVQETPVGLKVLPDLEPSWEKHAVHHCSLKEAVLIAIRQQSSPDLHAKAAAAKPKAKPAAAVHAPAPEQPEVTSTPMPTPSSGQFDCKGVITAWGEEKIPKRKKGDEKDDFYKSFAIRLRLANGTEKVVPGEGLRDAIAETDCKIGDRVGIKKLEKVKVPAFLPSGQRRMKNGEPDFNEKWVWSITHI